MKSYILLIIISSYGIFSQKIENIVTDRPDQTESASIVPELHLQIESGSTVEKDEFSTTLPFAPYSSHPVKVTTLSIPSILIRYGLLKNLELRLGIEYVRETINTISVNQDQTYTELTRTSNGLGPFLLGMKVKIMDELEAAPEMSLILGISVPHGDVRTFQQDYIGTDFRFTMKHTLSNVFTLSYNLGGEWNGDDPHATGIYTLSLGVSLAKKLSAFIESYGFLAQEHTPDHRVDGGLTYLFEKNIQADISGGFGITKISPDYFIGAGLSVRLPR